MSKQKKKKERWIRRRHRIVRNILCVFLYPYTKIKYGITVEKFKNESNRPYLILYNHQTLFDQFFVGMSFSGAVYYLASEDIFSNGLVSSLIRWLVNPIPIKKQAMDIGAVRKCMQVVREGGAIAIAPEGNRTYSGRTEYMSPSIAHLAKRLGLPIALYRIEGGYGVHPRWSDVVRKGKMRSYVSRVIEPEEYASLTDGELFEIIRNGLYVNEGCADGKFLHERRAEFIERILYVCPFCGLSSFESHKEKFKCKTCEREIIYGESKELEGVGFDLPFRFVGEWYDYQNDFVAQLDLDKYYDGAMYCDEASLYEVVPEKKKKILCRAASIRLYGDKITVNECGEGALTFMLDDVHAAAVLGRNKLNIYHGDKIYQIKGSKSFNAVRYVNIFFRHKNIKHGDNNGKFLGL